MAFRAERTQKQGRERHPHPLLRRAHGDKGGHNNGVPDDGVAAVHRAYGAQYPEIRLKAIYHAPNEEKALEALGKVTAKWTMPFRNWGQVYGELLIMYEGRLPE